MMSMFKQSMGVLPALLEVSVLPRFGVLPQARLRVVNEHRLSVGLSACIANMFCCRSWFPTQNHP